MKRYLTVVSRSAAFVGAIALFIAPAAAFAAPDQVAGGGASSDLVAIGIGMVMGLAALGGTFAQGKGLSSGLESMGRNPSAAGKIQTAMIVGLAFIESLVVLSFVIAFLMRGAL